MCLAPQALRNVTHRYINGSNLVLLEEDTYSIAGYQCSRATSSTLV